MKKILLILGLTPFLISCNTNRSKYDYSSGVLLDKETGVVYLLNSTGSEIIKIDVINKKKTTIKLEETVE